MRPSSSHSLAATRKKYPGLTDLKALRNTSRKRLERIVLSRYYRSTWWTVTVVIWFISHECHYNYRKSLERVARSVDQLDERKFDDKFGNNYNYALN